MVIGVDVGSSGCKVTALGSDGVVVARSGIHSYPIHRPGVGWAEQDPHNWYRAACLAIRECLQSGDIHPGDVRALCIDGPAHNVAILNAAGEVIYPSIHWSDLRSVPQSERLERQCGDNIFRLSYQRVNPSWTLPQLLWLKENEPGVWSRLRMLQVTKDYVRFRFTGIYQTDVYDAIGTQLYEVDRDQWSPDLCGLLNFPPGWLPDVLPANALAGKLLRQPAHDAGLLEGTPVAIGSGDSVVEALGVGAVQPGQCIVKLGTAANVNLVTRKLLPSAKSLTYRHLIDGHGFTIAATNSGASTMRWFGETFCRHEAGKAKGKFGNTFEVVTGLAAKAPGGCQGLIFHPYLMGERSPHWDPHLRGDFVGIGAHHGIEHFARAILEGVAFSIRDCLEAVEGLGQKITERYLLGGGAKSALWCQILCDVLGARLLKPGIDDASFGAALVGAVAIGQYEDYADAVRNCVKEEEVLHPGESGRDLYSDYFRIYQEITEDLRRHSHRLAKAGHPEQGRADKISNEQ